MVSTPGTPGGTNTDGIAGTLKFAYYARQGGTPTLYSDINTSINLYTDGDGSTSYVYPGITGSALGTGIGLFIYNYSGSSFTYTLGKIIYSDTTNATTTN
jgi:hypothetical protein